MILVHFELNKCISEYINKQTNRQITAPEVTDVREEGTLWYTAMGRAEEKCMKEEITVAFPSNTNTIGHAINETGRNCIFLCVLQIKEFLPNRMGQSPPDVPGGGRQVPHVDGTAGQSTHTVEQ